MTCKDENVAVYHARSPELRQQQSIAMHTHPHTHKHAYACTNTLSPLARVSHNKLKRQATFHSNLSEYARTPPANLKEECYCPYFIVRCWITHLSPQNKRQKKNRRQRHSACFASAVREHLISIKLSFITVSTLISLMRDLLPQGSTVNWTITKSPLKRKWNSPI